MQIVPTIRRPIHKDRPIEVTASVSFTPAKRYSLGLKTIVPSEANSTAANAGFSGISLTTTIHTASPKEPATDADILVKLSPSQRWSFLARNRPMQFWSAVAAVICSCFVLTFNAYPIIDYVLAHLVTPAFAQQATNTASLGWDVPTLISVVMSLALLWSYGIVSFSEAKHKIDFASNNLKFLLPFLAGLVTGKIPK